MKQKVIRESRRHQQTFFSSVKSRGKILLLISNLLCCIQDSHSRGQVQYKFSILSYLMYWNVFKKKLLKHNSIKQNRLIQIQSRFFYLSSYQSTFFFIYKVSVLININFSIKYSIYLQLACNFDLTLLCTATKNSCGSCVCVCVCAHYKNRHDEINISLVIVGVFVLCSEIPSDNMS